MNPFERAGLWLMSHLLPGFTVTGQAAHVLASDNRAALIRLSTDPLTIHDTRFDSIAGLVDLMDAAAAAAPRLDAPALVMYGGKDEVIPPKAVARVWRAPPPRPVRAFYPEDYHLMLRDHERGAPIGDIISWLGIPRHRCRPAPRRRRSRGWPGRVRISRQAFPGGRFAVWRWCGTRSSVG